MADRDYVGIAEVLVLILGIIVMVDGVVSFLFYSITADQSILEHVFRFIRMGIGVGLIFISLYLLQQT